MRVYSSSGARKAVPPGWASSIGYELAERGGMATGWLQAMDAIDAGRLSVGDRVDVWLYGAIRYRGWVRTAQGEAAEYERSSPTLQGLAERLGGYRVSRVYAYGTAVDLADIAADVIADYVTVTGRWPSLSVTCTDVGVTARRFDGRGKSVAQALSALCDLAGGAAYWQCGVDGSTLADTLTWGPRPTSAGSQVYALGGAVEALIYPVDTSAIANRVQLRGGPVAQPNLCPNGSFELLSPSTDTGANLLYNPSFEEMSGGAAVGWNTTVAAEWIAGAGHSGGEYLRLGFTTLRPADAYGTVDTGLPGYWTRILEGTDYRAAAWVRRFVSGTASEVRMNCFVLNSAGALLGTISGSYADPGNDWTRITLDIDLSAYPTAWTIYVGLNSKATNAAGGIAVDDVSLYIADAVAQDDWAVSSAGAATVGSIDLQVMDPAPMAGGLCLKLEPADVATASTDYLEVRTRRSSRIRVTPGQLYTLLVWWTTDGAGSATVSAGLDTFMADDTAGAGSFEVPSVTGNPSGWQLLSGTYTLAPDDQSAEVFVRVRANQAVYLDCVMLVAGDVPSDVRDYGHWWADTSFEALIDTSDAALTGLSTAAAGSIAAYGEREAGIDQADVVDQATLVAWATGYFNAAAVPVIEGKLTITARSAADLVNLGSLVRVVGLPTSVGIGALMPSRVRVSVGEAVRVDADLGSERPSLTGLLGVLAERRGWR